MIDFKNRLKKAQLPTRSIPVCLRGDLVAEWESADRDLKRAQEKPDNSLEGSGTGALVDRIEALQADMSEHTDDFRLQALPKWRFRALVAAHPPRVDDDNEPVREDAVLGVNRETFFPALIRASVIEPVLDDDDWRVLLGDDEAERKRRESAGEPVEDGVLTDRQIGDLEDAAWFLNRAEVNVPFSHAASRARRSTGTE